MVVSCLLVIPFEAIQFCCRRQETSGLHGSPKMCSVQMFVLALAVITQCHRLGHYNSRSLSLPAGQPGIPRIWCQFSQILVRGLLLACSCPRSGCALTWPLSSVCMLSERRHFSFCKATSLLNWDSTFVI